MCKSMNVYKVVYTQPLCLLITKNGMKNVVRVAFLSLIQSLIICLVVGKSIIQFLSYQKAISFHCCLTVLVK